VSDRQKRATMLVVPNPYSRSDGNTIILAWRAWRSKYITLQCFCKRPRKDGTCKTLDGLIPLLAHPERARYKHDG
jgi:hypothetical protein